MPKDMRQLMQQAQQMQEQMVAAQAALADKTYEGTSGGGVVKATIKGSGELISVDIDPTPSLRWAELPVVLISVACSADVRASRPTSDR
jgi:hypothetical protein